MFSNTVKTEWIEGEKRNQRLLEDVIFTDSKGVEWIAEAGSIINGASIPRFLWVWGSPFVGHYRRSTVLHDVYCQTKSRPHKAVHKMFHEAIKEDGTKRVKANLMYRAVRLGGPTWK